MSSNQYSLFQQKSSQEIQTHSVTENSSSPTEEKATQEIQPAVMSVEQLNKTIRQMIEGQLNLVWVRGELSNFKAHTSGHFYFSLKDSKSQIRAVMFRGFNSKLRFKPTDGMEVIIRGRVTVYEPRGEYQITCEMMEPVGAGALQKAFEQLKEKLRLEGLFDAARKRSLPLIPKHIAIVTSPTGAAIQDMMNVLSRRNKAVPITVVPTLVQGEGSAAKICQALKLAWSLPDVDVIIVGRGGGSIEDLWAFNDESLARLIAQSPVPVISAVGHEVDFTIADFVADVRAPTPSAAAELVVKNTEDLFKQVQGIYRLLVVSIQKKIKSEKQAVFGLSRGLVDPQRRLQDLMQKNDDLILRLQSSIQRNFSMIQWKIGSLKQKLSSPEKVLTWKQSQHRYAAEKLEKRMQYILEKKRQKFIQSVGVLESLSPLKVLERGYSIVQNQDKIIHDSSEVEVGDRLRIGFLESSLIAKVESVSKESLWNLKKN